MSPFFSSPRPWCVAVALSALPAPVQAAGIADCVALADDRARLACYDAAAGRAASSSGAEATAGAATSGQAAKKNVTATASDATAPADAQAPPSAVSRATGRENLADPAPPPKSLLGEAWALDSDARDPRFNVRFHNPNYVIGRYSDHVNQTPMSPSAGSAPAPTAPLDANELNFQVSFKARLWETENRRFASWLGYTQQSNWQILNEDLSRPFRETDYMPELMFALRPDLEWQGWRWRLLNLGVVHQSNGRAGTLSRSWNRAYAQIGVERGDFAFYLKPWVRFTENPSKDDNPDIVDYMGHGEVQVFYRTPTGFGLTFTGRLNGSTGKGAARFEMSTPPLLGPLRGYVQVFTGYGESLVDYNWRQTTIGAGLSLNDLF